MTNECATGSWLAGVVLVWTYVLITAVVWAVFWKEWASAIAWWRNMKP